MKKNYNWKWLAAVTAFVAGVGVVFWLLRAAFLPRNLWDSDIAGVFMIPALLVVAVILLVFNWSLNQLAKALRRLATG